MIPSSISRIVDVRQRDCQLYECLLKKKLNVFWSALFARDYGDLHAHTIERRAIWCMWSLLTMRWVLWHFHLHYWAADEDFWISSRRAFELIISCSSLKIDSLHSLNFPPFSHSPYSTHQQQCEIGSKWIFCHAKIVRCIFHIVIVVVSHCTSKWVWGFKDIIKSVFLSLIYDLTWRCSPFPRWWTCNCSLTGVMLVFVKYLTSESEAQWECPWTMWKRKLHSEKEKKAFICQRLENLHTKKYIFFSWKLKDYETLLILIKNVKVSLLMLLFFNTPTQSICLVSHLSCCSSPRNKFLFSTYSFLGNWKKFPIYSDVFLLSWEVRLFSLNSE